MTGSAKLSTLRKPRCGLLRCARNDVERALRQNADFPRRINVIWVIQPHLQKYSA
jgi:hypothetical protein